MLTPIHMVFIVRVRRLRQNVCYLIKQKHRIHIINTHTQIICIISNTLLRILSQTKRYERKVSVKLTLEHNISPRTHGDPRPLPPSTHTHARAREGCMCVNKDGCQCNLTHKCSQVFCVHAPTNMEFTK